MRIGELSRRTGASRRSLRYYEEQGLLESTRSASGQRHYSEEHVERVGLIRAFLAAGVSSTAIADMIPCMKRPSVDEARRAARTMARERARLTSAVESLRVSMNSLEDLMETNRRYLAEHS
ncbi:MULTISPECIES: MerR family transcriptional regulator [Nocardiopsidaceae]|uniref:MerR family transcriptional regulator n=1 Tax=Streptomonospora nanhaiensis TaxID=1323731 RepID=A0ABY6YTY5_9ACTN|nr:MerR family transcriptional regulator [Streptomonospora nanhaiensis]WAE75855.1 MerR family transcriptional regulator [Streptomonospora nanhaiensis]